MRTFGLAAAGLISILTGCEPSPVSAPAPARDEPAAPRDQIDNPQYQSWARFPKGTTVIHRSVTRTDGTEGETVTTTTYTLVEMTPERTVVEVQNSTRRYDGLETRNPPAKYTHPRRIAGPPGGTPAESKDEGEEKLLVSGREYHTRWHKTKDRNEAGEVFAQVWSSAEVPGSLVKSVMRTPAVGKTTVTELVEVRSP
ncbi:MAG TPA: hypothetical protein VKD90_15460 [Gemmataceae bacterium]|nr:hypothetical protein [Gemmataceae bacterium]